MLGALSLHATDSAGQQCSRSARKKRTCMCTATAQAGCSCYFRGIVCGSILLAAETAHIARGSCQGTWFLIQLQHVRVKDKYHHHYRRQCLHYTTNQSKLQLHAIRNSLTPQHFCDHELALTMHHRGKADRNFSMREHSARRNKPAHLKHCHRNHGRGIWLRITRMFSVLGPIHVLCALGCASGKCDVQKHIPVHI